MKRISQESHKLIRLIPRQKAQPLYRPLSYHLHCMKELEATPAIIMSAYFSPLLQAELALYNLFGLERSIKVVALVKAIDQLFV
jgi:hypothetical protein